jgi:hypothetical protein
MKQDNLAVQLVEVNITKVVGKDVFRKRQQPNHHPIMEKRSKTGYV